MGNYAYPMSRAMGEEFAIARFLYDAPNNVINIAGSYTFPYGSLPC